MIGFFAGEGRVKSTVRIGSLLNVKKCNNSNYLIYFVLLWINRTFYLDLCGKRKKYFFAANI